jgi:hypothetical protein
MKKLLVMLGLPLLLTGCQSDELLGDVAGVAAEGAGNVNFSISIPDMMEGSRSMNASLRSSAAGGITNVDMTEYDLRYQMAIYRYDSHDETVETKDESTGEVTTSTKTVTELVQVIAPQVRTVDAYLPITYSLNLSPNQKYRAVVWADFVEQGSDADLHYDTSVFPQVTCKDDADHRLNDESRDAYTVCQDFEVGSTSFNESLTLKRALAKIRIVTTDWNQAGVEMPDNFKLTYKNCDRVDTLNISVTGKASRKWTTLKSDNEVTYTAQLGAVKEYGRNYDAADCNRTVIVDYIFGPGNAIEPMHFQIEAYNGTTLLTSKDVTTDIPTRTNWLTTVMGNLLSANCDIKVECDERFEDEYNNYYNGTTVTPVEPKQVDEVYQVGTVAELFWISKNATTLSEAKVALTADIDLDGLVWTPIDDEKGYIASFDGQGHTIYNMYINQVSTYGGLFGNANVVTISNVTLQNVTIDSMEGFIGGIAGSIGLGGGPNLIENCTVNNIFVRTYKYDYSKDLYHYNVGGIVGNINIGELKNCKVVNADLECGWRIGGLVGFVNLPGYNPKTVNVENCSVEHVTVWNTLLLGEQYDEDQMRCAGALAGLLNGGNDEDTGYAITFSGCSASDITYKYWGYWDYDDDWEEIFTQPLVLHDGDEGKEHTFEYDDRTISYGPEHMFYGVATDIDVIIE